MKGAPHSHTSLFTFFIVVVHTRFELSRTLYILSKGLGKDAKKILTQPIAFEKGRFFWHLRPFTVFKLDGQINTVPFYYFWKNKLIVTTYV